MDEFLYKHNVEQDTKEHVWYDFIYILFKRDKTNSSTFFTLY